MLLINMGTSNPCLIVCAGRDICKILVQPPGRQCILLRIPPLVSLIHLDGHVRLSGTRSCAGLVTLMVGFASWKSNMLFLK